MCYTVCNLACNKLSVGEHALGNFIIDLKCDVSNYSDITLKI